MEQRKLIHLLTDSNGVRRTLLTIMGLVSFRSDVHRFDGKNKGQNYPMEAPNRNPDGSVDLRLTHHVRSSPLRLIDYKNPERGSPLY